MQTISLLNELYGRLAPLVPEVLDGLSPEDLVAPPSDGANTIGWLVWHMGRVQDHHLADVMGVEQIWTTGSHAASVGLDADPENNGYGNTYEQVLAVRPESAAALADYFSAVLRRSIAWIETLDEAALDRVVDTRWYPPVTLGVRLVSVAQDGLEHAGQAAYARGMLGR